MGGGGLTSLPEINELFKISFSKAGNGLVT